MFGNHRRARRSSVRQSEVGEKNTHTDTHETNEKRNYRLWGTANYPGRGAHTRVYAHTSAQWCKNNYYRGRVRFEFPTSGTVDYCNHSDGVIVFFCYQFFFFCLILTPHPLPQRRLIRDGSFRNTRYVGRRDRSAGVRYGIITNA